MAAEIQLLACGYTAQCTVRGCRVRATRLARYTDGQDRPLRQRELCDSTRGMAQGESTERSRLKERSRRLREPSRRRLQNCDAALDIVLQRRTVPES